MILQTVMEEALVYKGREHTASEMEIEIAGRVLIVEKTPYGLEITRFVSSNPLDYLNSSFEPRLLQ